MVNYSHFREQLNSIHLNRKITYPRLQNSTSRPVPCRNGGKRDINKNNCGNIIFNGGN